MMCQSDCFNFRGSKMSNHPYPSQSGIRELKKPPVIDAINTGSKCCYRLIGLIKLQIATCTKGTISDPLARNQIK
jgi:hypothetical protein